MSKHGSSEALSYSTVFCWFQVFADPWHHQDRSAKAWNQQNTVMFNQNSSHIHSSFSHKLNGLASVYPVLSSEGKKDWEQIEEALYREELTTQGYNKYRRRLFQKENFIPPDRSAKEKQQEEKEISDAVENALSTHAVNSNTQDSLDFRSKEECAKVLYMHVPYEHRQTV